MLTHAIIPPYLLSDLPTDSLPQRLFCNIWLGILSGFIENGAIILPQSHSSDSDYLTAISTWPPKYRKRAQELLTTLKLKKRLLPSPTPYTLITSCVDLTCQPFTGASTVNLDTFQFHREACAACPTLSMIGARAVEPTDFFTSDFHRIRSQKTSFVLRDGQWKSHDFEREILAPIFKTAKHVKIYDRYIGRSIVKGTSGATRIARLKDTYKSSLELIIKGFANAGGPSRGGVFEIYCGVDGTVLTAPQRAQVRIELLNLQSALQVIAGSNVRVFVKNETKTAQCPHGRYLITDQIAVLIERGFELLWDNPSMTAAGMNPSSDPRPIKDVAMVLCNDCSGIESYTKLLPDL